MSNLPKIKYEEISERSYAEVWEYQKKVHKAIVEIKLNNRNKEHKKEIVHRLIFCEHKPVYTLGKSGSIDNLLVDQESLKNSDTEFFKINRGGDITFHGPGQITGYPIFDLDCFFTDVHKYVRYLEEVVIRTIAEYGIVGERIEDFTGVWIKGNEYLPDRKICAIGVHLSRWVTMHGFALNVNPDLTYFNAIIPCGIAEDSKIVTSMSTELKTKIDINEVKLKLKSNFASLFEFEYIK